MVGHLFQNDYLICAMNYLVCAINYLVCAMNYLVFSMNYLMCSMNYLVYSIKLFGIFNDFSVLCCGLYLCELYILRW